MGKTKIEWTTDVWNPIRGCSPVSPGCKNCYAAAVAKRFSGEGQPYEGLVRINSHGERTDDWNGQIHFIEKHLLDPIRWKNPRKIFVNSMSDLFHENVTDEMRDKIFAVMALAPQHQFQILTKRPERMRAYFTDSRWERVRVWAALLSKKMQPEWNWPLDNVWLGVSVENAKEKHRIATLRKVPAAIRFLSLEPLLGPLGDLNLDGISWAITGGESGPHARPMLSHWVSGIKDQCDAAGVAFFHKQNGEFVDAGHEEFGKLPTGEKRALRSDGTEWNLSDMPEDENADVNTVVRVGRKRAGETLYGEIYHAFPEK